MKILAIVLLLLGTFQPNEPQPTLGNELIFPDNWELSDFSFRYVYQYGSHIPHEQQIFICSKTDDNVTIYRYCRPIVLDRNDQ